MRRTFLPLFLLSTFPLLAADCGPEESPPPGGDPSLPTLGCETVLCQAGTYCEEIDGEPVCVPADEGPSCDDVVCDDGQHCELVEVQCVRAPCPPQPTCVIDEEPAYVPCLQSSDCSTSQRCDLSYCDRPPGCGSSDVCATVCYGRCVDESGSVDLQ